MKSDDSRLAFDEASAIVEGAEDYTEIFPKCKGNDAAQRSVVRKVYIRLAKAIHPDQFQDPMQKEKADQLFRKLQSLDSAAEEAIKLGNYGEAKPKVIFETKKGKHTLGKRISSSPLYESYEGESIIEGITVPTIIKVTRNPNDNDLAKNEQAVLKKFNKTQIAEQLKGFVTELIEGFTYKDALGEHRVSVLANSPSGFIDIETLRNKYFPEGLDPKHVAWIWRKVLLGIEFADQNGYAHGALLPSNILINPELHGVVLSEWSYSVDSTVENNRIAAIDPSKREWYPSEILNKEKPNAGSDIYLAAQSMIYLLGGDPVDKTFPPSVPVEFQRHLKGCTVNSKYGRPSDPIEVRNDFDFVLESIGSPFHPRKFAPLTL